MSLPADVTIDNNSAPMRGNDVVAQLNNAITEIRTLRTGLAELAAAHNALAIKADTLATAYNATLTKLDSDAGVTGTDYHATNPAVVTFESGNAVVATAYATDSTHIAKKLKH